MTATVKVRLRTGQREIEIEGLRADIDELLDKWWTNYSGSDSEIEHINGTTISTAKRKSTGRKASPRAVNGDSSTAALDPNAIANQIKEHEYFAKFEKIFREPDGFNKIALILWMGKTPLTSGQIHKILEALDVRISLPNVSNILKANISKFLTSAKRQAGGPPATYRLSAQARADFESWLQQNGE